MTNPIEAQLVRSAARLLQRAVTKTLTAFRLSKAATDSRSLANKEQVETLLAAIGGARASLLEKYVASPDFDEAALHMHTAKTMVRVGRNADNALSQVREELRYGIRHAVGLEGPDLLLCTDVVFDALLAASQSAADLAVAENATAVDLTILGHITSSIARNSSLLARVADLGAYHDFATDYKRHFASLNSEMRLPHAGISKTVPYRDLYVEPSLSPINSNFHERSDSLQDLMDTELRVVVLGGPGAGKSTLITKRGYDLATAGFEEYATPFVLILREIASGIERGGKTVVEYIEARCRDPYNSVPPDGAIEYLLLNGRATVVFDGLDELTDVSLRARMVRLIEGFVRRYPLAPVIVTSRSVGYDAAPLDSSLFASWGLAEFDDARVGQYAHKWFHVDPTVAMAETDRLADSFLDESARVLPDVRRSPLMLSLLCAMYSSERYLPRNRPEVFEKCSTMLFDRWDRMRGISARMQYGSRLRSAIQHLAWQLYNRTELGGSLSRNALVQELAQNHFLSRTGNLDDALDDAESFTDFCLGRAWVLTDVGSTELEPRFGFAHRTFLEYFAAQYLTRSLDSSPERLLERLSPHIAQGEWEIVSQIALQIVDRNVNAGCDRFLERLVERSGVAEAHAARKNLIDFACRALGFVSPSRGTIQSVLRAAVALDTEHGAAELVMFDLGQRPRYLNLCTGLAAASCAQENIDDASEILRVEIGVHLGRAESREACMALLLCLAYSIPSLPSNFRNAAQMAIQEFASDSGMSGLSADIISWIWAVERADQNAMRQCLLDRGPRLLYFLRRSGFPDGGIAGSPFRTIAAWSPEYLVSVFGATDDAWQMLDRAPWLEISRIAATEYETGDKPESTSPRAHLLAGQASGVSAAQALQELEIGPFNIASSRFEELAGDAASTYLLLSLPILEIEEILLGDEPGVVEGAEPNFLLSHLLLARMSGVDFDVHGLLYSKGIYSERVSAYLSRWVTSQLHTIGRDVSRRRS